MISSFISNRKTVLRRAIQATIYFSSSRIKKWKIVVVLIMKIKIRIKGLIKEKNRIIWKRYKNLGQDVPLRQDQKTLIVNKKRNKKKFSCRPYLKKLNRIKSRMCQQVRAPLRWKRNISPIIALWMTLKSPHLTTRLKRNSNIKNIRGMIRTIAPLQQVMKMKEVKTRKTMRLRRVLLVLWLKFLLKVDLSALEKNWVVEPIR
jgi:hypothetical protein